jgi:hypothetical protein
MLLSSSHISVFLVPRCACNQHVCASWNSGRVNANSWVGRLRNLLNMARVWVTDMDVLSTHFYPRSGLGSNPNQITPHLEKTDHATILYDHAEKAYLPSSLQPCPHPTWEIIPTSSSDFTRFLSSSDNGFRARNQIIRKSHSGSGFRLGKFEVNF